jgi:hypothetical protein
MITEKKEEIITPTMILSKWRVFIYLLITQKIMCVCV